LLLPRWGGVPHLLAVNPARVSKSRKAKGVFPILNSRAEKSIVNYAPENIGRLIRMSREKKFLIRIWALLLNRRAATDRRRLNHFQIGTGPTLGRPVSKAKAQWQKPPSTGARALRRLDACPLRRAATRSAWVRPTPAQPLVS